MLEAMLEKHFGFNSFRQGQKEVIQDVLAGLDVLAMLPTGSGKSLCYQLPGYCLEGPVLVVTPLLSLMEDQVQGLKRSGEKKVVALNSQLARRKKQQVLGKLSSYRFIYASPEIVQNADVISALKRASVSLFVVDEAHCISQWGHEFRTDYLKLNHVLAAIGRPPCLALTATATKAVQDDIVSKLELCDPVLHIYSVDRPNIGVYVEEAGSTSEKITKALEAVRQLEPPGIIYFSSREWTERFASLLKENGINRSAFYHGGMETEERLLIQQQFLEDGIDVICCTNAFGMGVNKANVRFIIHFHYPRQIELFLQEAGRAGRDGKNSAALTFYENGDHDVPERLIGYEFPTENHIDHLFHWLINQPKTEQRVLEELYAKLGMSETAGRFVTYRLERLGILTEGLISLNAEDVDDLKKAIMDHIQIRKTIKLRKLVEMRRWLLSKTCRRKAYLQMFDEPLNNHPELCCDRCGLTLEHYKVKKHDSPPVKREYSWRQDLRLLLKQSGGSNES